MTYIYDKNISYDIYDKLKIGMNYICIIHKYIFFLVCPMFSLLLPLVLGLWRTLTNTVIYHGS